jgi:hypothetical protein
MGGNDYTALERQQRFQRRGMRARYELMIMNDYLRDNHPEVHEKWLIYRAQIRGEVIV